MQPGHRLNEEQFPILLETQSYRVYKNPTNEIFIETANGKTMRISPYGDRIYIHGDFGVITPSTLEFR